MLTINKAVAVIAVLLLGIWSPEASAADPKPEGEPAKKAAKKKKDPVAELFIAKCASCHSVGKGDRVGPDLKDVHKRRDRAWLTKMVATPSSMLTSDAEARKMLKKYKNVKMPDLGLKASQVKSLVELLAP